MHPATHAFVDLNALAHNVSVVKQNAPTSKIMAVIKANAYGHGLLTIAQHLNQVDALAVARVDEGIKLRENGLNQRIVVLQGFISADELTLIDRYQLEPVIHSNTQVDALLDYANKIKHLFSVWLKIDTGMNRLGLSEDDFHLAYHRISEYFQDRINIQLMTHLSNADSRQDIKTKQQVSTFLSAVSSYDNPCSIANSAAILDYHTAIKEWVRPGLMLFGVSPFPDKTSVDFNLKPVMSFFSRLIAIKTIKEGETVGYGSHWTAPKTTRIGIASIGYGDGYPRHAEYGTPIWINGRRAPLIGPVSMDMITLDLTDHPEAKIADQIMLWGKDLPIEEIAIFTKTIPYTLLCGITQRVKIFNQQQ